MKNFLKTGCIVCAGFIIMALLCECGCKPGLWT